MQLVSEFNQFDFNRRENQTGILKYSLLVFF